MGRVYSDATTLHHKDIDADKVKVAVSQVIEAGAPVPIATEEVVLVGQAPGHFLLWPKELVKPYKVNYPIFA